MNDVLIAALASVLGSIVTYAVMTMQGDKAWHDKHTDAYEEGWADGYDIGKSVQYTDQDLADEYSRGYTQCMNDELDKAPVKPKRVKKIRKADQQ